MRKNVLIAACALLAFLQTMAYYAYLRDDPGNYNGAGATGDQVAYIDLAQQVAHGSWSGAVHYMPGLPAVIAVAQSVFGGPRLGIAVVQGMVFALLVVFVARLSGNVWSAAAVGLNPALGYYAAQALTEFLTACILVCVAAAILGWSRTHQLRYA